MVSSPISGGEIPSNRSAVLLEHDPEKWKPVFGKDHAQGIEVEWDRVRRTAVLLGVLRSQGKKPAPAAIHIPSGPRAIATIPVRDTSTSPSGSINTTNWSI